MLELREWLTADVLFGLGLIAAGIVTIIVFLLAIIAAATDGTTGTELDDREDI